MGEERIVSYPLVTKWNFTEKNQQYVMQEKVMKGIRMEYKEEIEEGDREVFLDFRKSFDGEIKIKVKNLIERNETVKSRVKKWDKDNLNILNIFIDTVSRNNFHRKYKKTKEFLEKYNYLNKKEKRVYEFFRLHSIRGYTFPNLFASTYGIRNDYWNEKHLNRIDSYAKKAGYITGLSSDCCVYPESESKSKRKIKNYIKFFIVQNGPYNYSDYNDPDHMFYQIACDYNNMPLENPFTFGFGKGPYSVARNCFMGRDLSGLALEYAEEFFKTYEKERKFFTARIISAHEFTGENSWFIDEELSKFLKRMDEKGYLENTILNIFSDHGDHIDFLMWNTESGYSELMNPFLTIMVPESLDQEIGENLKENQQRLITHFQLFQNLVKYWKIDMSEYEHIQTADSLFYDRMKKKIGCEEALIKEDCKCFIEDIKKN